jgi:hypothetical protein
VVLFRRVLALVVVVLACAPQAADRGMGVLEADAGVDLPMRADRLEPSDGPEADSDPVPDGPERDAPIADADEPDASAQPDAHDAAPDVTVVKTARLVVGNALNLTVGDDRVRSVLTARNLIVTTASDGDEVDVEGMNLVVLASSCDSEILVGKYRDVAVPVLVMEPAVFDEMGMIGSVLDSGEIDGSQVSIARPGHLMAAGLMGDITVVSLISGLGWGRPGAGAERVAIIPGNDDRVVIFGYPVGASMSVGHAAARRVGAFVTDVAARRLNDNGVKLLGAAIDWALQ